MLEGQLNIRKRFTLGSDPEMFVFSGNKLLPAFKFLPSKANGALMYYDGFQAEWKYEKPHKCQNNLVNHTRNSLMILSNKAKVADKHARLSLRNVVRVPNELLQESELRHVELGCMPSFNAYNLHGEDVVDPRKLRFRFAGGHMHFGSWTRRPSYQPIVKTLDNILGVWSVGAARHLDNPVRRQFYGLPGEYRRPIYKPEEVPAALLELIPIQPQAQGPMFGLEYRVLSNFWLASPAIMQLTWDIARSCVRIAQSLKYRNLWAGTQDETVDVIKNCDFDQATKIIKRNEPMMRWILSQSYQDKNAIQRAMDVAAHGLEVVTPDPENIPQNWHFDDEWLPDAHQPWARWEPY